MSNNEKPVADESNEHEILFSCRVYRSLIIDDIANYLLNAYQEIKDKYGIDEIGGN